MTKKTPYRGLILEGGGATGIGHIGALEILKEHGILEQITHFVGSSAGAVVAAALACGASPEYMKKLLFDTDFNDFLGQDCLVRKIWRFFSKHGLSSSKPLDDWICKMLKELTGDENITFGEMCKQYGNYLEITITDLTLRRTVYINCLNSPDMSIRDAVLRSTMMPLVFVPFHDKKLTPILINDKIVTKDIIHVITDGGTLDNYPIDRLDKILDPSQVIGLKLVTRKELIEMENPGIVKHHPPVKLVDYLKTLHTVIRNQALKLHVKEKNWKRTIPIEVGTISSTDFGLSDDDKFFLIQQGRAASTKFLNERQILNSN